MSYSGKTIPLKLNSILSDPRASKSLYLSNSAFVERSRISKLVVSAEFWSLFHLAGLECNKYLAQDQDTVGVPITDDIREYKTIRQPQSVKAFVDQVNLHKEVVELSKLVVFEGEFGAGMKEQFENELDRTAKSLSKMVTSFGEMVNAWEAVAYLTPKFNANSASPNFMLLSSFVSVWLKFVSVLSHLRTHSRTNPLYDRLLAPQISDSRIFRRQLSELVPFPIPESLVVEVGNEKVPHPEFIANAIKMLLEQLEGAFTNSPRFQFDNFNIETRQLVWAVIGQLIDQLPRKIFQRFWRKPNKKGSNYNYLIILIFSFL